MRVISLHLHLSIVFLPQLSSSPATTFSYPPYFRLFSILRFVVFIEGRAIRIDCIECNVIRIPRFSLDISICLELLLPATRCLQYSCSPDLGYCVDDNAEIHGGRAFSESIDRNGGGM